MKKVTVHISEEKYSFLIELLKSLDFIKKIETSDETNQILEEVKTESAGEEEEKTPLKVERKVLHGFLNKL